MSLLLPSKERSSLIRFIGFDLKVRCAVAHLLLTTSNAIIAVLGGASAIWYNLRSHIGGRRKGERERLLYRRVSKSCHYAIAYETEQSTSSINVSPPPAAPKLSKLLLWSERSPLSTSVLSKEGRICYPSWCYNKNKSEARVVEVFSSGIGDLYYPSNDLDPYIKDKNDDDDSEKLEDRSLIQLISSLFVLVLDFSLHPQELKSVSYNTIYHSIREQGRWSSLDLLPLQKRSIKEKGSPSLSDLKFYLKTRSSTEFAGAEGGNFWPPNLIHHHLAKLLVLYIHILSSKNSTY
ncbi:hypothetical protein S245_017787 [Arachis hypogaea]